MRSKNTDKYTDYYTFIEDVNKYYSDYLYIFLLTIIRNS